MDMHVRTPSTPPHKVAFVLAVPKLLGDPPFQCQCGGFYVPCGGGRFEAGFAHSSPPCSHFLEGCVTAFHEANGGSR